MTGTAPIPAPLDQRARPLRDLRISVTDRCNFRCSYCMPKARFGGGFAFLPRAELLSFEEIARVARLFADAGVTKIRLTGGEPLLRRDLERLVKMLAGLGGIDDIALTTNGSLLASRASGLALAGLTRVTVSLDALDDALFRAINDVGFPVSRVLAGIDAAAAAGLPVKVNMVVKRGLNDACVIDMAEHFRGCRQVLRFIEYMDVGGADRWRAEDVVPSAEIVRAIDARWPLEQMEPSYSGEVARRYRYRDGSGEIGVVAAITEPFCADCTRARLSADGRLFTCLFAAQGHDLRTQLRSDVPDDEITRQLRLIWTARSDRYSELRAGPDAARAKLAMSYIGG